MKGRSIGQRPFSMKESYRIAFNAFRSMGHLRRSKHDGDLEGAFIEWIMLAVTEVNGCPLCSYAHTRMALESGMSMEEIQQMLGGSVDAVPGEQLVAVLFAQHYAETRGNPTRDSWERVVDTYGRVRALGILGSIRAIMLGNALGIPFGSLLDRLRGRAEVARDPPTDLGMLLCTILTIPASLLQAGVASLRKEPLIDL